MNVGELKKALEGVPDECPVEIGQGNGCARKLAGKARYMDADSYEGFPDIFAIDELDSY